MRNSQFCLPVVLLTCVSLAGCGAKNPPSAAAGKVPAEEKFQSLDADGDGRLTVAEFQAAQKTPEQIEIASKTFKRKDKDGDGALTFVEYHTGEWQFRQTDSNGDMQLSLEEYVTLWEDPIRVERAPTIFEIIDRDGDGMLSLEEFTDKSFEARFKVNDLDDDGGLTFEEFKGLRETPDDIAQAERVFSKKDLNADDVMTFEEFAGL